MILSAQTIRMRCVEGTLVIRPFCERSVIHGMSFGLSSCGYDVRIKDGLQLEPGGFALATTVEYFEFPNDVRGCLADKSTWARRGIAVQNTRFEPGWRGYPTVEISNHSLEVVTIRAGSPIGQMEFVLLDAPTLKPYKGRYQDQAQVPTPSTEATEENVG